MKRLALLSLLVVPGLAGASVFGISAQPNSINFTNAKSDIFVNAGWMSGGNTFAADSFLQWHAGSLTRSNGTFGWTDGLGTETGNSIPVNADRGDDAAMYAGQMSANSNAGTLREVFRGSAADGYAKKNLNWILDSEDNAAWSLTLMFGGGRYIMPTTGPEIMILERGANSGMMVEALDAVGNAIGMPIALSAFSNYANSNAGFSIDNQEVGQQKVAGVGVDLGFAEGANIYGVRITSTSRSNGPDIVGVASIEAVPEPGTMAALGAGALALLLRRKKA